MDSLIDLAHQLLQRGGCSQRQAGAFFAWTPAVDKGGRTFWGRAGIGSDLFLSGIVVLSPVL